MTEDRSTERPLFIAPDAMSVGITPDGQVSLRLGKPHPDLGFEPDIVLAAELSPAEARFLADQLLRAAREAEGGSSQH